MNTARDAEYYLAHLDKWRACSAPELQECKLEDLFEGDFAEWYTQNLHQFWWQVIRLHETLVTLDEMRRFPFDDLYGPQEMEFWRLVIENFLDMACLKLHAIVTDEGPSVHGLTWFKGQILHGRWRSKEKRGAFQRTLRERKFGKVIRDVQRRVQEIRNKRVAHHLHDGTGRPVAAAFVSLDELWQLFDAAHSLFGALCFGSSYATLMGDLTPSTVAGEPVRTCLDGVLDGVLRASYFVNKPERRGRWWPTTREHQSEEKLRLMNELRIRIGLPPA